MFYFEVVQARLSGGFSHIAVGSPKNRYANWEKEGMGYYQYI